MPKAHEQCKAAPSDTSGQDGLIWRSTWTHSESLGNGGLLTLKLSTGSQNFSQVAHPKCGPPALRFCALSSERSSVNLQSRPAPWRWTSENGSCACRMSFANPRCSGGESCDGNCTLESTSRVLPRRERKTISSTMA